MSSTVKWFGLPQLNITPGAQIENTADRKSTSLTISGPYSLCASNIPALGSTIDGYPGKVQSARLLKDEAGIGKILVSMEIVEQDLNADDADEVPQYSVAMVSETKPLETHPMFADSMGNTVTYLKSAQDTPDKLATWESLFGDVGTVTTTVGAAIQRTKTAGLSERLLLLSPQGTDAGGVMAQFFGKWDAGQEVYPYSYPVLRRTTQSFFFPNLGRLNFVDSSMLGEFGTLLPKQPDGSDYSYLKTGDSVDRSGRHGKARRQEEWKGALAWDADIYPGS